MHFNFFEKANLLDVEIKEVNEMMACKDADRGFFTYYCKNCGTEKIVHFGCNSHICTNCGKNHTDKRANSLRKALFNVPHRHAVLTIPDVLWSVVRENRFLLKVLMDAVEALLWVGILTLIVSRRVYRLVYSANLEKAPRYTHLRWATIFAEKSQDLLDDILDYAGINTEPMDIFELFQNQALDPNVNRKRLMDIWRA
jgi:hypothetical protein